MISRASEYVKWPCEPVILTRRKLLACFGGYRLALFSEMRSELFEMLDVRSQSQENPGTTWENPHC